MWDGFAFLLHNKDFDRHDNGSVSHDIDVIGKLYQTMAIIGKHLDDSLYLPMPGSKPKVIRSKRKEPLTKVWYLKNLFKPKQNIAKMATCNTGVNQVVADYEGEELTYGSA